MKTTKYVITAMLISILYIGVYAQETPPTPPTPPKPPKDMAQKREMVEAMKTGFFTKELNLTPEEAQKFWPVYNMYDKEMKELQKAHREKMKSAKENMETMSDKDAEVLVDNFIVQEQKELDIKKKYHGEFKKILPIKKVGKLYHAEDKFKKELLEKMKEQRPQQPMKPIQPNQSQMPEQQQGE